MTETPSELIAAYRLDQARSAVADACTQTLAEHGSQSPQHAAALLQLGRWHFAAGEYSAAEPLLKQALQYAQNHSGDFLSAARQAQAALWNESGRSTQVLMLFSDRCSTPGEQIEYGAALASQGNLSGALTQFETAAAALAGQYGLDSAAAAHAYAHVAAVYRLQGYAKEALSILSGCLNNVRSQIGKHHPHAADILAEMAAACAKLGDHGRAALHYRQAEHSLRKTLGSAHIQYGRTLAKHAYFLAAQGKTADALLRLQHALVIYIDTFDEEHPLVHALIRHIAMLVMQQMHNETETES